MQHTKIILHKTEPFRWTCLK